MATQIQEAARSVDVVHETDVLVVGSGPGGLSTGTAASAGT
jgi:ribulose 1,5-bisphosphate synthetase/thiazole synthase